MEDSGNSDIYGEFEDYNEIGEGYANSLVTDQTNMVGCKGGKDTINMYFADLLSNGRQS